MSSAQLSTAQRAILDRFRVEAQALPNKPDSSDDYYLRWLRARDFNYDSALDMLKKHLKWREEVGADQIFEWTPPEVLQKYFPGGLFGEDRDGHPVYYDFYGNIDIKGLYRSTRKEDIIKFKILHGETVEKALSEISEKKGRYIGTVTAVLNMENLSYQQYYWPSIQLIKELFQIFAENYPERSKSVYIINAPRIFPMAYNIFKHFVEEDTRNKLVIMGDNWREELLQFIAPDQLPEAFGGTRCEPDQYCSDHINWGGPVPESYYLTNQTETSRDDMESITVGRGSSHQISVNVDQEGTLIRWEFTSVDYDIGFGLFYKPFEAEGRRGSSRSGELSTLIPSKRTESHIVPENGFHLCDSRGTYVLRFDNTFSWTRSKEVLYSVQVLAADPNTKETCLKDLELTPPAAATGTGETSKENGTTNIHDDCNEEKDTIDAMNRASLEDTAVTNSSN